MKVDLVQAVDVGQPGVGEALDAFEDDVVAEPFGGVIFALLVVLVDGLCHGQC